MIVISAWNSAIFLFAPLRDFSIYVIKFSAVSVIS